MVDNETGPDVNEDDLVNDAWADDDVQPDGERSPKQKQYVLAAQIGLVVLALVVVGIVLLVNKDDGDDKSSSGTTTTQVTNADGTKGNAKPAWPATITGRPPTLGKQGQTADKVNADKAKPGVYVWSDFDGWHMWVVPGEGIPANLTGSLTSNDELSRAELAVPNTGTVKLDGQEATYDLDTSKGLTGMDFNTGFYGKRLVLTFEGPEGPIDVKLIKTGSKSAEGAYPLVIDKA